MTHGLNYLGTLAWSVA
ncbi:MULTISPECIES: CRISPR-associated DxTHG motif protein [Desulfitobacterium]